MNKELLRDIINKVGDDIEEEHWRDVFTKLDATRLATLFEAFAIAEIQPFDVFNDTEGISILRRLALKIKFMSSNAQRVVSLRDHLLPAEQFQPQIKDAVVQLLHYFKIFYIYKLPLPNSKENNYVFSLFGEAEDFFKAMGWNLLYKPEE